MTVVSFRRRSGGRHRARLRVVAFRFARVGGLDRGLATAGAHRDDGDAASTGTGDGAGGSVCV